MTHFYFARLCLFQKKRKNPFHLKALEKKFRMFLLLARDGGFPYLLARDVCL